MSKLICGENTSFSLDCHKTLLSNNVIVFGATGCGKSLGIVDPNIRECYGSMVIFDPKGSLYGKHEAFLRENGYAVRKLDFSNPKDSCHYNPLAHIHTTQDVGRVAHAIVYAEKTGGKQDPFWNESASLLMQAVIAYLIAERPASDRTIEGCLSILEAMCGNGNLDDEETELDVLFAGMKNDRGEMGRYARHCYRQFRSAANVTLRSILISTFAKLLPFTSQEVQDLTSRDDVGMMSLGDTPTALFVICSDTEAGTMDKLVKLFFTQLMSELCLHADRDCEGRFLPVPVRFILDDFACGVSLEEFPRSIAIIRSRNISVMVMCQTESQLDDLYGVSGRKTIISNCDTVLYMGGNDVETARDIAVRVNAPLDRVLYMPLSHTYVFRRGQKPVLVRNLCPWETERTAGREDPSRDKIWQESERGV